LAQALLLESEQSYLLSSFTQLCAYLCVCVRACVRACVCI